MKLSENIQDYIDGNLSDAEMEVFKRELLHNKTLKKEYDAALIAKQIARGLLEMDMREILSKENNKRKNLYFGLIVFIVLSLIAVFIYTQYFQESKRPTLYAMEYVEPLWPSVRGSNDELSSVLLEFRQGENLQKVKRNILEIDNLKSQDASLWIAELFLARNELDSAAYYLPSLPKSHPKYSRSTWINVFIKQQSSNQ